MKKILAIFILNINLQAMDYTLEDFKNKIKTINDQYEKIWEDFDCVKNQLEKKEINEEEYKTIQNKIHQDSDKNRKDLKDLFNDKKFSDSIKEQFIDEDSSLSPSDFRKNMKIARIKSLEHWLHEPWKPSDGLLEKLFDYCCQYDEEKKYFSGFLSPFYGYSLLDSKKVPAKAIHKGWENLKEGNYFCMKMINGDRYDLVNKFLEYRTIKGQYVISDTEIINELTRIKENFLVEKIKNIIQQDRPWLIPLLIEKKFIEVKDLPEQDLTGHFTDRSDHGMISNTKTDDGFTLLGKLLGHKIFQENPKDYLLGKIDKYLRETEFYQKLYSQINRLSTAHQAMFLNLVIGALEDYKEDELEKRYTDFFSFYSQSAISNGEKGKEYQSCNPEAFLLHALGSLKGYEFLQFFCDAAQELAGKVSEGTVQKNAFTRQMFLDVINNKYEKKELPEDITQDENQMRRIGYVKDYAKRIQQNFSYKEKERDNGFFNSLRQDMGTISWALSEEKEREKSIIHVCNLIKDDLIKKIKNQEIIPTFGQDSTLVIEEIAKIFNCFSIDYAQMHDLNQKCLNLAEEIKDFFVPNEGKQNQLFIEETLKSDEVIKAIDPEYVLRKKIASFLNLEKNEEDLKALTKQEEGQNELEKKFLSLYYDILKSFKM